MDAKPKMETISDQKREERVAGFIEGLWGVRCNKLPVSYGLDYWCESQESSFWLEVKCRSFGIDRYDTLFLSQVCEDTLSVIANTSTNGWLVASDRAAPIRSLDALSNKVS